MNCHKCGSAVDTKEKIGRQQTCPKCDFYLHCCLNCRFYSELAHHQCKEPQAEWVQDKTMANFCDYFEPANSSGSSQSTKADDARKKLDDLFK